MGLKKRIPVINEYDTMIIEGMPYICYDGAITRIGKDEGGIFYMNEQGREVAVPREHKELHDAVISGLRSWRSYQKEIEELQEAEVVAKQLINKEIDNIFEEAIGKDKMSEIKQKADSLVKMGSGFFKEIFNEIMPIIDEHLEKAEQKK